MRDRVDDILDQWATERPELDASPMGVVGRVSRASQLLHQGLKDHFASQGLERWEFDVLATLRRSGPPYTLTPTNLVAMAMVGSAAMTNRVDRLVRRGLVTRDVDPDNRRRLLITLTQEGIDLVDRVTEGHVANERDLLSGLTDAERDQLAGLLRTLLVSLGDTAEDDETPGARTHDAPAPEGKAAGRGGHRA